MNLVKLALTAEHFAQSQPPITVEALRCLRARDKSAACDRCVRTCPSGAIQFNPGVEVNTEACIRCGLCLHACPTGALSGSDNAHRLAYCVSQLVDHEIIEIACAQHPDPALGDGKVDAVVVTTGCLAAFGASAYLSLAAQGVQQVRVRLDACAQCPLAPLQPEIETILQQTNDLLKSADSPQIVSALQASPKPKRRPCYSVKNPPISRRGFFQALGQRGRDLLPSVEAVSERQRIVDALRQLKPATVDQPMTQSAAFTISNDCNACTTCARICPTGALEFSRNDEHFQLAFSTNKCIDCGLCLKYCEPHALQREGAATMGAFISDKSVILHTGQLQRCRKCHTLFAGEPDADLCPVCAYRRKNPFGGALSQPISQNNIQSEG